MCSRNPGETPERRFRLDYGGESVAEQRSHQAEEARCDTRFTSHLEKVSQVCPCSIEMKSLRITAVGQR
jgi:hypothetical protein